MTACTHWENHTAKKGRLMTTTEGQKRIVDAQERDLCNAETHEKPRPMKPVILKANARLLRYWKGIFCAQNRLAHLLDRSD